MEQQEETEQRQPVLRSIHNQYSAFVRFFNMTRYTVSLYWIDHEGKHVCYNKLGHWDYVDINTFETHPWIFVESETKDRFLGNGQEVYFPKRSVQLPARVSRTPVYISLPLRSLRDLCLREIKRLLRHDRDAFSLEIPWILQRELYFTRPRKPEDPEQEI